MESVLQLRSNSNQLCKCFDCKVDVLLSFISIEGYEKDSIGVVIVVLLCIEGDCVNF